MLWIKPILVEKYIDINTGSSSHYYKYFEGKNNYFYKISLSFLENVTDDNFFLSRAWPVLE